MTQENNENPTKKEYWEIKPNDSKSRKSFKVGRKRAVKVIVDYMDLLKTDPNKAKEYLNEKSKLRTDRNTKRFYFWLVQELNWLVGWLAENYDNRWEDYGERIEAYKTVLFGDDI